MSKYDVFWTALLATIRPPPTSSKQRRAGVIHTQGARDLSPATAEEGWESQSRQVQQPASQPVSHY